MNSAVMEILVYDFWEICTYIVLDVAMGGKWDIRK